MTFNLNNSRAARNVSGAVLVALSLMACAGTVPSVPTEPVGEVITLTPQPGRLILSGVQGQAGSLQRVVLKNLGSTSVRIDTLNFIGSNAADFTVESAPRLPLTLDAGGQAEIGVRLAARTSVSRQGDVLRATLQASGTGTVGTVALSALRAFGLEGDSEPTLARVVETLGFRVNVGTPPDPARPLELGTGSAPIGDEVRAPLFRRAGEGAVTLTPVARYSPDGATPFGFFTLAGSAAQRTVVGTVAAGQYQTLNPASTGAVTFNPGAQNFGVFIDPSAYAYPLTYTQDSLNTGQTAHAVRTYPMRDAAGQLVANSYLLCFEPSVNGDYQDVVFILENVRPAQ